MVEIKSEFEKPSKGKRRAVSPAMSDTSACRIAKDFRNKRVRQEKPFSLAQQAFVAPSHTVGESSTSVVQAQDTANGNAIKDEIPTPPSEPSAEYDDDLGSGVLQILMSRRSNTKIYEGAIEEIVERVYTRDYGFGIASPPLPFFGRVAEGLNMMGDSGQRINEAHGCLKALWRNKLAQSLGQGITSSHDLSTILYTITAAMPFRPENNGLVLRLSPEYRLLWSPLAVEGDNKATVGHNGVPNNAGIQTPPSETLQPAVPARLDATGAVMLSSPKSEESPSIKPSSSAAGLPEALRLGQIPSCPADLTVNNTRIEAFQQRFAEPFDTFFYHLERYRLLVEGRRPHEAQEREQFKRRARVMYDAMDGHGRKQWRPIHNKMQAGNIEGVDETLPRQLLTEQKMLEKMQIGGAETGSLAQVEPLDVDAVMIPFVRRDNNCDTRRRVVIIVNTPDLPTLTISQSRLHNACALAFGTGSSYRDVEQWSEHMWVARFEKISDANRAKGLAIVVNGVQLMAEHMYSAVPRTFSCDFTDLAVGEAEAALRVRQMFASAAERRPQVWMQKAHKLYEGRQVVVELHATNSKLLRFYVPMQTMDDDGLHIACFKPIDKTASCALCREKHDSLMCSAHAKPLVVSS